MVIHEMTREECFRMLAKTGLARLACALENQPYVVPVYLAFYESPTREACFYGFTSEGQKVEWMRANPRVCVEVDEIVSSNQWISVVVSGCYEELPGGPAQNVGRPPLRQTSPDHEEVASRSEIGSEQLFAHRLLQSRAMWWEPATTARAASAHRGAADPLIPIFYKIRIDQVTGHSAVADSAM